MTLLLVLDIFMNQEHTSLRLVCTATLNLPPQTSVRSHHSSKRRSPAKMKSDLRFLPAIGLVILAITIGVSGVGCSSGGAILAGAAAGAAASSASSGGNGLAFAPAKLMLFGGSDHKVYLGCLNCSTYATDSIANEYGSNGSRYSSSSILNHYSEYGSPYSSYSACNPYASDPPVIVDSNGKYYGRLTKNAYHSEIGIGRQYMNWLDSACQG
jgi:hypothetical protein